MDPRALQSLPEDQQQTFQQFGLGEAVELPHKLVHLAFEAQARANPDAVAVENYDGTSITYARLDRHATYLAQILRSHGVGVGDHVGVFVRRSVPMIVGILATLKVGAAYVPQHVGVAPDSQLQFVCRTAAMKVVLTLSELVPQLPSFDGGEDKSPGTAPVVVDIQEAMAASRSADFVEPLVTRRLTPDNTCYIIFTSGTTGTPKGVQVTHRNVTNLLLTSPGNLGMAPGLRVGQILSIQFDMGAWEMLGCLMNGATLVLRGKSIQQTVRDVDVVISTPTILGTLDADVCRNVKVAAVAGEPCSVALANRWSQFCTFYNSCGPTETTIINTAQQYSPRRPLTIGKPTPNNTVYVLKEDLQPCSIGEVGVMWAGGDAVTAGYLGRPDLTRARYEHDPFLNDGRRMFNTGDLGRWNEDGELEHYGRVDDQVKIKGFRVELDGVTSVAESTAGVERAVALKIDEQLFVVITPSSASADAALDTLKSALPYYAVPTRLLVREALPLTKNGKIDKRQLIADITVENEEPPAESVSSSVSESESSTDVEATSPKLDEAVDSLARGELPEKIGRRRADRAYAYPFFSTHRRLMVAVAFVNFILLSVGITNQWWNNLTALGTVAVSNIFVAVIVRQQRVINALFALAILPGTSARLGIRWALGKIYHFGGLHSSCSVAAAVWILLLVVAMTYHLAVGRSGISVETVVLSYTILLELIALVVLALPPLRTKYHNSFERTHRFGGWSVLLLVWVQTVLFVRDQKRVEVALASALASSATFWMLLLVTWSIIYPWTHLRKVPIEVEKPSDHVVVVKFDYGVTPFPGSSTAISVAPLLEWHSFANVPTPGKTGYRLVISRAGDWTGRFIDNPPTHVWVRGIPTAGVARIETLFRKVLYVATGSGIGPVLPHLLAHQVPARLLWTTRDPRNTYGDSLVNEIIDAEPGAIVYDTTKHGKPDMVQLTFDAYQECGAEAVIIISNQKLTRKVVYGLESRGIPCFGAIWDS